MDNPPEGMTSEDIRLNCSHCKLYFQNTNNRQVHIGQFL